PARANASEAASTNLPIKRNQPARHITQSQGEGMKNQFLESRSRHAILSATLATCLMLGAVGAQAADKKPAPAKKTAVVQQSTARSVPCDRVDMGPTISVTVGKSTLVKLQTPITRIVVGNP